MTLREQILAADDLKTKKIHVADWKLDVFIKQLSGKQQDVYEEACRKSNGKNGEINLMNARARFVATALVDEDGKQLFTFEDIPAIGEKSSAVLNYLVDEISKLNRITMDDIEDIAKN